MSSMDFISESWLRERGFLREKGEPWTRDDLYAETREHRAIAALEGLLYMQKMINDTPTKAKHKEIERAIAADRGTRRFCGLSAGSGSPEDLDALAELVMLHAAVLILPPTFAESAEEEEELRAKLQRWANEAAESRAQL